MFERIFSMGLVFIVTIFVARYLEPEKFGILSYSISFVSLFAIVGHMGLSGLIVREIVKFPEEREMILGTTFFLKSIGIFIGFISIIVFILLTENVNNMEFWVLLIVSLSILFQPIRVIDFWFSAHLQAKYTSISNIIATILTSIFKILLVVFSANLVLFAFTNLFQAIISSIVLIYFYKKLSNIPLNSWRKSSEKARKLLSQGWIIFLGSIFAVIYLKIDQVMLKWMIGNEEVGIYAVASQLSEAWYFIPTAIVASFFPKLIKLREENEEIFNNKLQKLFNLLFILAFIVAILVSLFAKPIILLFFGEVYLESASILIIHIWAALFIFMRAAFSKWILIENVLMFSLITQGLGTLSNILLNLILIPKFGGEGAAFATLISYAVASYFSLLFYNKTRVVFKMMTKAIFSPILMPFSYLKGKI